MEALDKLPENCTDIFQRNMLGCYIERPDVTFNMVNRLKQITFVLLNFYHITMYNQNLRSQQTMILSQ